MATDEVAKTQAPRRFDSLRYVMEASDQCRAQIKQQQENLAQIDHLCAMMENLQTGLADAKTVVRAMAEADNDSDSLAVQAIARTFLRRFEDQ